MQFLPYPYADGHNGYMVDETTDAWSKRWSARVRLDHGSDLEGVGRNSFALLIETSSGWGVDLDWKSYVEDLGDGQSDELHLGDVNILYRLAESDISQWRVGIGMDWLGDAYATDYGINFTMKVDFYPFRPLVFSSELDLGTIGDAEHLHAAATVGLIFSRVELFGGYDYCRVGDVNLQGPQLGLRFWF